MRRSGNSPEWRRLRTGSSLRLFLRRIVATCSNGWAKFKVQTGCEDEVHRERLGIEEQPVAKRSEANKGAKQSEPEQAIIAQDISCQPGVGSAQCWGGLRGAAKAAIRDMPVCN